ncbi:hypothetical protein [Micromonospora sp. NBC_00858]|uniref:hypothetical protein n=1 Tax=Micromonospora sp. NBC_00858 TaxID=2975979 RepID=UPI003863E9B3|nr:hypothetical protein OG990_26290 [Micromonospora sp. NBC_00858]
MWDWPGKDGFVEIVEYADQAVHDRDQLRVGTRISRCRPIWRVGVLLDGPPQVETYRVDTPQG